MKKILPIVGVLVLALLFWAPWMGDGDMVARELVAQDSFQAELKPLINQYACVPDAPDAECCDGLSNHWAPFGRKVTYCEYGRWYLPFWK
ncbi:MAG: hypothetical protein ACD_28C00001G0015 [uncultured bacterium]|nr:MAG: hypothetical protein ACD_28C00001G0015 [uncultured bacterium]KKT74476.1 MAG: hypothetical protein UW70_C0053G0004 [Candidatus Peregrinibacteria bacterium GW2011_GWA2_44_7]